MTGEGLLRRRVKRQSDGVFDHAELVYRIDYVLGRVLGSENDGRYSFAHDFSVDHEGRRGRLHVVLQLDESWSTSAPSPIELQRDGLGPNEKTVLALSLAHSGSDQVETGNERALVPPAQAPLRLDGRLWAAGALLLFAGGLVRAIFWRARRLGHFEPAPRATEIDWSAQRTAARSAATRSWRSSGGSSWRASWRPRSAPR